MTIPHPVGQEWMCSSARGEQLRVYMTVTDTQGRVSVRAVNDTGGPCGIRIVESDGTVRADVTLPPGPWPGPTEAEKQALPGTMRYNRIADFSISA